MKNKTFDSAETYDSLFQFQITLPESMVVNDLITHLPKGDFQTLSKITQFCVSLWFSLELSLRHICIVYVN